MSSNFKENTFLQDAIAFLKMVVRQVRSFRFNRNFLVFLVFLVISTFLWFIQTSKETSNTTVEYRIKIVNCPKDIIFTSKVQDTIKVHMSAKGETYFTYLFAYLFHRQDQEIPIDYNDIDFSANQMIISNSLLKYDIKRFLGKEFNILSVTPSKISAYYTTGKPKKVPIVFDGKVGPSKDRIISSIDISPDSANVYVPYSYYDSVKVVYADCKPLNNIVSTTKVRAYIKQINKVKIYPDSVDVTIHPDYEYDRTIPVKIQTENCPEDKVIKYFPGKVNLTFRAVSKDIENIDPEEFSVIVDYNKIKPGDKYCNLVLGSQPGNVSNVRFSPKKVQYVLE